MRVNVTEQSVVNAAIIDLSNKIMNYVNSDQEAKKNYPKEFSDIETSFINEVTHLDNKFIITKDILFGHIFYDELCSLLHNPWAVIRTKEFAKQNNIKKLATYLAISKSNPDLFSFLDAHAIYAKDIEKVTSEEVDKYMGYAIEPLISVLEEIQNIINPVKDDKDTKTEIRNYFGISIDDISDKISGIFKLIDDKKFTEAKGEIMSFINSFKETCDDWIDSIKQLSEDAVSEAIASDYAMNRNAEKKAFPEKEKNSSEAESSKKAPNKPNNSIKIDSIEAVKTVLRNHGYTSIEETPGSYKDTMYLICTNAKNIARYFLVDLNGVYCNTIPKIFIATPAATLQYAVHVKDFSKWLEEADGNVEKTSVNYVVSDKYLELSSYGIDLCSDIVLANSKKLYSLIRSNEWKTFTAVYHPSSIMLMLEQIDNILSVKTAVGEALFSIRDVGDNKCLVSTESGWDNIMSRPNRPLDPFVQYANS